MAKVSNREDALLNAYMTRYKNAQAGTVSEGQRNTSTARARGAAILNATDKTLPALKDTYSDTLSGIVQGASLESSLTNDILDRNLKLAKARFDQANDLNEQLQKAQQYAEKQAAKAAKAAAKSSRKSKSTSKGSSTSSEDAAAALAALEDDSAGQTTATSSTAGKAAQTENEKSTKKAKEKSAQQQYLEAKQNGTIRGTPGNSYAERNGTGSTATPTSSSAAAAKQSSGKGAGMGAQGESFQKAARAVIGALTAPARADNEEDKRSQYQKRQLVDSGRAFTKDGQVNQRYAQLEDEDTERRTSEKSSQRSIGSRAADLVKGVGKQAAGSILSFLEAPAGGGSAENRQAQHDMRMLMENGLAMNADGSTSDAYQKALNRFEDTKNDQDVLTEQFVPALGLVREGSEQVQRGGEGLTGFGSGAYNVAAMGASMAPGMALGLVNPALGAGYMGLTAAGNKVEEESEKGMGSRDALLRGAASGLISTGTNAVPIGEFANITKNGSPILQAALKEGVENAGQEAADYLLNTAADYALKDPDASFSLQDMAGQVGMGAATGAAFGALGGVLNKAVNGRGTQEDVPAYEDNSFVLQNSDDLPIDAQRAAGYNEVNGGVQNDNLGAGVRADVSLNADAGAGYEPQPGGGGSGLAGQTGTAGLSSTADGNGRGVQGPDAPDAGTVAEWARSITGKDRRSVYTRRIEDLYSRMQSGATRESMADEAKDIALGIVKDSDFAEPVDEATAALRDYLKSTPIRLDEKAAGDILYTSGLKNIQQYNFQNGTNFSTTSGLPYDTALMELADMGTGVSGSGVDDLLSAVAASNRGALVDTDQAAATADYYRDMILDGPTGRQAGSEDFTDWLEVQGFDSNMPDYTRRVYDRMFGGTDTTADAATALPATGQTAEAVSAARPLNGSESVPENAVGAESTQYDRREVLNQDYANQRAMGGKIDADEAAAAGIGQQTHTVYSRAEGKDTAKQDFDLLVQQNGDILSAGRTVADELTRKSADGNFDASDVYRGYYAADQLQNMLNSYEKGSADAQLVQAQIENLNRAVSAGQSKNAQALSAGRWAQIDEYTPIRKFEQITQRKVNDFAKTRDGKQLESLATDVVEMAKSGPQDEEFTAFLKAQGVDVGDNPLNAQMDDLAMRIKRMADTKGVKATDEQAKSAAASILAGGNADDVFNAMARKSLGIENLSQEDYDYVKNAFAEMADMPDSKARYEKEMDAYKRLTKYMPAKTFGDKMESIRYLSMLGNTRTHARNVLGNVSMGVVTRAKDNVSGVMQLALPKDQRTKAVGTTLTADGRRMVDLAKEYGQNKMYSVLYNDGKFNAESGLRAAQDTFTSKPGKVIQKAADLNSALLEKEDNIFLTSAFGNAMASQLKARGYDSSVFTATDAKSKQALVDAAATALRDAKEATFHEDNFLSTALKNFQNDIKGHGVEGKIFWAVGEGILPFKKTPLNIAKNAMEYNIVGGTVEAAYRYATGASNADVIDAAAKGLTGTALMGIGGILAYNGLLNGSKSGDDRADAFDEMTGKQEYSINIPGKGTYTIDWASPASVPLLMGAEIANEWQNGGLSVTKFLDAARKIGNPILDTTMLQGLNDTLDSVSYADSDDKLATLLMGTLGSYAQQYVPTAFGQIARTIDPMRRSTYGGGDSKTERDTNYAIRKAENKIPGLSMNNEPYIDQWGREEASLDGTDDSASGMFLRGVYNFGSPGYLSAENITPVDEYLQGLYGSTNDSHVYPEKASSKITVDSDDYYMTPEEKTEYAKTSGQTAYDLIDELRQNDMFLRLPEDQQSALVQDAYSVAKTVGGVAAVGDGVSGVGAKEYEAYRDGGAEGFSQYVLMKNATDLVRDEKRETSGNDSAKLNDVETWNTLYSQFGEDAVSNFVNSTKDDSTVRNISDLAGDKAVTAYMQSYSAVAKTLDDGQTPDKFTVGYGMQKYGLSGDDFARAYLAAYYKKDKNGKYPEKGSSYADKAGAEIYQRYGADALRDWVNYRATIPDTNGNGKVDKDEAMARLNEMDLTNEMRRAYLTKTNKQWKNPY
uniref:Uncharacterized protein n=1 Tax=Ackermannviridae sp. TaxID=2831612 RepID=A0A8S5VXR4_9CAUD|nr:MAG TPA: hypothetical protein [Ackermannviridae sp.]